MEEKLYTEKELVEYLGREYSKRQGIDRISAMCRAAGLIIAPVAETVKGKGAQVQYRIIEDNYMIPGEMWIDTFISNEHEVSNLGRVRQKKTKRLLGYANGKGYLGIQLNNTNISIHRLVFFSFHPELISYEKQITIDHINGIRTDNRLENLQPLAMKQNSQKMDKDQTEIRGLLFQVIQKMGYEDTKQKLLDLLENK